RRTLFSCLGLITKFVDGLRQRSVEYIRAINVFKSGGLNFVVPTHSRSTCRRGFYGEIHLLKESFVFAGSWQPDTLIITTAAFVHSTGDVAIGFEFAQIVLFRQDK